MKRVMCGKMTVGCQNVEIAKGPGCVVYKVGAKGGQQQCSDGSPKASCKLPSAHNQNDAAAWNLIALSMCLRPQSPDPNGGFSYPLPSTPSSNSPSTTSLRTTSDGEKPPASFITTSSTNSGSYSGFGSSLIGDGADREKRSRLRCSTDSDKDKSILSHFQDQFGGIPLTHRYGAYMDSCKFYGRQPHESLMDGLELCTSSSSIGGCDDRSCSLGEGSTEVSSSGDVEVVSSRRGGPLTEMSALEASLPLKRGLSRFWNGKAKSFSSLAEVSSIEELAKPENPYNKRRRTTFGERHKSFPPLSRTSRAGISKRPTSSSGSRSCLAMAVAMGSQLVQAPNSQRNSPCTSVYSGRSMSLTDPAESTSETG